MTTSGQQPIIKSINFSELKPLEVFKYPYQASSILWGVNSSNFSDSISQIADLIKTEKTPIKMALYLIDIFSNMRVKNIAIYAQIYKKLITDFSISVTPSNQRLETLISTDFKFDGSEPQPKKIEEILDVYSKENPLYYITWDKVDELKSKFPNIDVNQEYDENLTPIDCACKFGSELCFNFLKNIGAKYTTSSASFAIQGGNHNIISQMIEEGQSFDTMINVALDYRNFEIAEYLVTNFNQIPSSLPEHLHFGNYGIASYLLTNGADINEVYNILFHLSSIII